MINRGNKVIMWEQLRTISAKKIDDMKVKVLPNRDKE